MTCPTRPTHCERCALLQARTARCSLRIPVWIIHKSKRAREFAGADELNEHVEMRVPAHYLDVHGG